MLFFVIEPKGTVFGSKKRVAASYETATLFLGKYQKTQLGQWQTVAR